MADLRNGGQFPIFDSSRLWRTPVPNEAMYLTMNLLTVSKYAIQLGVYKSE